MLTLLFFAFVSGLVTIAAPCIWPILPIVLSAGVTGGRRRPIGIVIGLVISFTVVTLALASLLRVLPFDPEALRLLSVIVIGFLGVSLLVPRVGARLEAGVSRLSSRFGATRPTGEGFVGGVLTGAALGIVWSPCAGPILAAVATLAATREISAEAVLVTLAFSIGIAIPLFLFVMLGRRFFSTSQFLRRYTGRIQQVFGGVMIIAALAIWSGYDKMLQAKILGIFPNYGNFLTSFEKRPEVEESLQKLRERNSDIRENFTPLEKSTSALPVLGVAPEFREISTWLNTAGESLSMADLRGKVVLVDFWTYSCINCIRTLPYVTKWYEKYRDNGLVIVGVHTPEFQFEHKTDNVMEAMKRYSIQYPVAQDNDYGTWQAYGNHYWPAHYLIDAEGRVRYTHFGEGKYDETERNIQKLLEEAGLKGNAEWTMEKAEKEERDEEQRAERRTPETYLGLDRIARFASAERAAAGERAYTIPNTLPKNSFAYGGTWSLDSERATTKDKAVLELRFIGNKVFLVMAPPHGSKGTVKVFLDGMLAEVNAGVDVREGIVTVDADRLYELIDLRWLSGEHTLRLEFETPGLSAYAFTFG